MDNSTKPLTLPSHWNFDFTHGTKTTYPPATLQDFEIFRNFAHSDENWNLIDEKPNSKIWDQSIEGSSIKVIRIWAKIKNVTANTLYDVLHDPDYRREWDDNMVDGYKIEQLDSNNDIGYYSVGSPFWLVSGRDFCNMRSWFVNDNQTEFIIFNHSVPHKDCPEKPGYVRAISLLTGYLVKPDPDDSNSCILIYITQVDAKGSIPTWIMNHVTTLVAPTFIKKISETSLNYNAWKENHNPQNKPWLTKN
jgi:hypothetical protein